VTDKRPPSLPRKSERKTTKNETNLQPFPTEKQAQSFNPIKKKTELSKKKASTDKTGVHTSVQHRATNATRFTPHPEQACIAGCFTSTGGTSTNGAWLLR